MPLKKPKQPNKKPENNATDTFERKRNKSCRINSAIKSGKTVARDIVAFCTGL